MMDAAGAISDSLETERADRRRRSGKASRQWAPVGFFDSMRCSGSTRRR
jgi:hypothetical protein